MDRSGSGFQLAERASGVVQIDFAGVGQANVAPGAVEQLYAQHFFQEPDLLRKRRLRHVQRFGGACKAVMFRIEA